MGRLRAENQDLPRLRKEIKQLQDDNIKLAEQLGKTSEAAQMQQQQLQEMQAQNDQAAAGPGTTSAAGHGGAALHLHWEPPADLRREAGMGAGKEQDGHRCTDRTGFAALY